jgi:hypothetical protein
MCACWSEEKQKQVGGDNERYLVSHPPGPFSLLDGLLKQLLLLYLLPNLGEREGEIRVEKESTRRRDRCKKVDGVRNLR